MAIGHSVNHLFALKWNLCCLSHTPLLWGNNKISISGTFELVYQRWSSIFTVENLGEGEEGLQHCGCLLCRGWVLAWGCQGVLGYVFRFNCLAHLHDRGLAIMKAVKLHPQEALCQERPESIQDSITQAWSKGERSQRRSWSRQACPAVAEWWTQVTRHGHKRHFF